MGVGVAAPGPLDGWLRELGVRPLAREEREGVTSWDLELHGRRRRDIRITVILQPEFACLAWVHYAPPLGDSFRKSYRQLLRWNDELPFTKFALAEDERLILTAELPAEDLDRDRLGLALARLVAVCDLLRDASSAWIWPAGPPPPPGADAQPSPLLERFAAGLGELALAEPGGSELEVGA
ncbi:MAG: YbjN domain-containing protein [Candidatus Limnocylindrales bacterium]